MQNSELVSIDKIRAAAARIAPYVKQTPVIAMTPSGLLLKAESLHPVGAFKIRGAFNALLSLSDAERKRGVVAQSSGNHAQAVAYAARMLGIKASLVMRDNAPAVKLDATRRWGAEVHLVPYSGIGRAEKIEELSAKHGYVIIPPFDHPAILAGTGTIGLEIIEQRPDVETIYVPISGGGLIGGVAAAAKQLKPSIRIIGVEPELACDAQQSFRAGRIVAMATELTGRTIADGLRVGAIGKLPFANMREFVDDVVTVSEEEIRAAMRRVATEARLVAEPSGAVSVAGALGCGGDLSRSVAVLSGGNVELSFYASIVGDGK